MITLYTAATSNGCRTAIMLEETGLSYDVKQINLSEGEQREPEFLKLNPAHGIPVIVDHVSDNDEPLVLTQSVAILLYLAEKSGQLMPQGSAQRAQVYQ
jgi:GST-like protein